MCIIDPQKAVSSVKTPMTSFLFYGGETPFILILKCLVVILTSLHACFHEAWKAKDIPHVNKNLKYVYQKSFFFILKCYFYQESFTVNVCAWKH